MIRSGRGLLALGFACLMVASASAAAAAPGVTFADDTPTDTPTITPTAIPTVDVPTTLQQVIQHSNDEQVQAIATSNLSLVSDTVTGDYAQQLTSSLQSMHNAHVTSISLLNLQWGGVTVAADGQSGAVTTFETWRVVSTAGSVDDEPTRNDYSMVLDNGTWKIAADNQTVGAPTPAATNTPTVTPTPTMTSTPTDTPTAVPTVVPTDTPTPESIDQPSDQPVDQPSDAEAG